MQRRPSHEQGNIMLWLVRRAGTDADERASVLLSMMDQRMDQVWGQESKAKETKRQAARTEAVGAACA